MVSLVMAGLSGIRRQGSHLRVHAVFGCVVRHDPAMSALAALQAWLDHARAAWVLADAPAVPCLSQILPGLHGVVAEDTHAVSVLLSAS